MALRDGMAEVGGPAGGHVVVRSDNATGAENPPRGCLTVTADVAEGFGRPAEGHALKALPWERIKLRS